MTDKKEIVAVGSIAFDSIKTSKGERNKILGGSSTYFSISSSLFTKIYLIGVVGEDFTENEWNVFKKNNIDTTSVEIAKGKTFSWGGVYNNDFSHRETAFTHLGVFENFEPKITSNFSNPILYLGNIQPQLQFDVINKINNPYLIVADSMNLWIDLYPDKVWDLIKKVDKILLNDEESIQLTKENDLHEIIKHFLSIGPKIVIIKMGSKGSLIGYDNVIKEVSVVPDTPVIDPTGAGDSFAGGLLGYIAANGLSNPIEGVICGTAVASYTVSAFGLENLFKMRCEDLKGKMKMVEVL